MKNLGILLVGLVLVSGLFSVEKQPKVKTVEILTSSVCGDCKDRIETELNYTKGVIFSELNLDTKIVTVKYKTKVLSENDIKVVIANLGYDAGETKRNDEAFGKLPKCCQSEGHCAR